jgi:hypothetical protein
MRLLAMLLPLAATPSPAPPLLSPQLLIGEWHIESGGTYHFRTEGSWSCCFADMIDGGRWKLRGDHTLDLTLESPGGKTTHDIIVIDRIVHETLYVRTRSQREVWLKQPGP